MATPLPSWARRNETLLASNAPRDLALRARATLRASLEAAGFVFQEAPWEQECEQISDGAAVEDRLNLMSLFEDPSSGLLLVDRVTLVMRATPSHCGPTHLLVQVSRSEDDAPTDPHPGMPLAKSCLLAFPPLQVTANLVTDSRDAVSAAQAALEHWSDEEMGASCCRTVAGVVLHLSA